MKEISRVLITAGPTREQIDRVRFISNYSSGNMGYELAKAALKRKLKVTLISGPTNLKPPKGARFIQVENTVQMNRAVRKNFKNTDCVFMTSAVSDWRPKNPAPGKIKKNKKALKLNLVENPDILKGIGRIKKNKIVVGFALESRDLVKNAKKKLKEKNLDLIVGNTIGKKNCPFGSGKTDIEIIHKNGTQESIIKATKKKIAEKLLDKVGKL